MKQELKCNELKGIKVRKNYTSDAGACTSLVLGIISSVTWLVPIIGLPITVVGTVLGALNFKSKKLKGVAIAGFVVNIVFMALCITKGILDIIKCIRNSN